MKNYKTTFYCTECGNEFPKWAGKCPACGAMGTYVKEGARTKDDLLYEEVE